jgi:small-conductance mechanosensitive channel
MPGVAPSASVARRPPRRFATVRIVSPVEFWRDVLAGWGPSLVALLLAAAVGWIFRSAVHRRLARAAERTTTRLDDLVLRALGGLWFPAITLFGLLPAARLSPLEPDERLVVERLALAGLLTVVTIAASRLVGLWFTEIERGPGGAAGQPSLVAQAARVAVLVLGGVLVLENVGLDVKALLTIAGVGSLAIGLALQPTLSNFFAGLHLSMSKPVRVGDFIELEDGTQGEVIDISWRATKLRQLANNYVIVPNNKVAEMRILNYSLPLPDQIALVPMGVAYGSDLDLVERVTAEVARACQVEMPEGDDDHLPVVRYFKFGDSAILFNVVLRARAATDRPTLVHEFIKRIAARYAVEGIEIPFPQRVVHAVTEASE